MSFEENEISANANGGTEIAKRKLAQIIDPELLDNFQIVSSRIRDLDPTKIRLFWAHDLPEDPESKKFQDKQFQDSFHKYVFISDWQYQRYQSEVSFFRRPENAYLFRRRILQKFQPWPVRLHEKVRRLERHSPRSWRHFRL